MEYLFRGPRYRLFPYERVLAARELAAFVGRGAANNGETLSVSVRRPLSLGQLRRLAFTSSIEAPAGIVPTLAYLLEQSALNVRNGVRSVPVNRGNSSRKESTYLTHGLHRFKGKFYPQLCRALINISGVETGELVLDPFMGSGTTLVECAISGIDSIGFDLNPLAHLIASTKIELLRTPRKILLGALRRFELILARECEKLGLSWHGFGSPEPPGETSFPAADLAHNCGLPEASEELARWFPPAVRHKLVAILRALKRVEGTTFHRLARVCLSDQIRSVSQQDPRDLRVRRRPQAITDAPLLTLLSEKLLKELEKLNAGIRALGGMASTDLCSAELRDARSLDRYQHPALSRRRVDAIVTSPPYANALPYIDTDRLSFLVLGLLSTPARNRLQREIIGNREIQDRERRELELEMQSAGGLASFPEPTAAQLRQILRENVRHTVGFRRRNVASLLYKYFRDMRNVVGRLYKVVRPGAKAFLVLGDSTTMLGTGEEVVIQTTDHISALAEQVGWRCADRVPIAVTVEDFAHVRNSITENSILVLERSPRRVRRSHIVCRYSGLSACNF